MLYRDRVSWSFLEDWKLHSLRIVFDGSAIFCTYFAYRNLPLVLASTIDFSGPLFSVLLARVFFNNRVTAKRWVVLLIGYFGFWLALKSHATGFCLIGVAALFCANLCVAFSIMLSKILIKTTPTTVLLALPQLFNVVVFMPFALTGLSSIAFKDSFYLLAIGGFALAGETCFLKALQLSKPSQVTPFEYLKFVFSSIAGVVIFKDVLSLNVGIGILIITFSVISLVITSND
jgi:drug/metabolite transporter (DMT)-like permease